MEMMKSSFCLAQRFLFYLLECDKRLLDLHLPAILVRATLLQYRAYWLQFVNVELCYSSLLTKYQHSEQLIQQNVCAAILNMRELSDNYLCLSYFFLITCRNKV